MKYNKVLIILSKSNEDYKKIKHAQHYFDFRNIKTIIITPRWYKKSCQAQIDTIRDTYSHETHKVSVLIMKSCDKLFNSLNFDKINTIILENPDYSHVIWTKEQLSRVFILTDVKHTNTNRNITTYNLAEDLAVKDFKELYKTKTTELYKLISGLI